MLLFGKGFDTWSLGSISTPIRHMSRKVPKSMSAHLIGQLSATRKEQLDEMETIANSLFQYLTPQESPVCVSELTVNAVVSAGRIMVKRFMWPGGESRPMVSADLISKSTSLFAQVHAEWIRWTAIPVSDNGVLASGQHECCLPFRNTAQTIFRCTDFSWLKD